MTVRRWPDLASLELLLLVAERGSLGKAASRYGITQASASRRLDTLEAELGVPLLHRSTTGSRLTPQGQVVVDWARTVLDACHDLREGVRALRHRRHGSVRVAASMTIAEYLMPGWLVTMRRTGPDVDVSLRVANSDEVCQLVRDAEIDIGFVESPDIPADLTSQRVATDRLVVVVAPGHRWARWRAPLGPDDLAATPLVVREPGSGTRYALERALAEHAIEVPALQLSSNAAVKVAVETGVAPAVLSALAVAAELRERRLVEVPVAGLALTRPLRAVWLARTRPPDPALRLVRLARAGSGT